MALTINTNVTSLNAQNNLATSQMSLNTALARLSSGLRINSAADDAAGYAIANRFTAQINGLNQAAQNANDAISLSQTAGTALNSIGNDLQRMRQLAVQSANATNSSSDRAALQQEVSQLQQEINRLATQTQFNGINLLDGSFTAQQFQVGANANQTITLSSIQSFQGSNLGVSVGATVASSTLTASTGITAAGQFTIALNGGAATDIFTASGGGTIGGNAQSIANAINASNISGLTATATATSTAAGTQATTGTAAGTAVLTLNGVAINIAEVNNGATDVGTAIGAINGVSAATGVSAVASGSGIKLTATDGRNITLAYSAGGATASTAADIGLGGIAATTYSNYTLNYSGTGAVVVAGSAAVGVKGFANGTAATAAATGTAVSALDISTVNGANAAITSVDAALNTVNTVAAQLGAYQNRFTQVVSSLKAISQDLSTARSGIQDADFASETSNLTRAQILQQAGTAMLAQANTVPQQALTLLSKLP